MTSVIEIEAALHQLPQQEKWQIARWLLDDLEANGDLPAADASSLTLRLLPDYAARRRRIFGNKVLPNLVLAAREGERW